MYRKATRLLFFLLLLFLGTAAYAIVSHTSALPSFSRTDTPTIVLDAGHGSPDGGAVGVSGTKEKDINLSIVLKLQEIFENRGARIILTREDDNAIYDDNASTIHEKKVSDMHNRLNIINNSNADLFLSIHMNSFSNSKSNGLHVFYARNHPETVALAEQISEKICSLTGAEIHEVKTASDTLYLMKSPQPAALLIECGFISNPDEEQKLITDEYQSKIAFAIADAVFDYYSLSE